jgi:hypothetical protein
MAEKFKDFISAREFQDKTMKQATVNSFQIIPHSPFITIFPRVVPWLRELVAGPSPRRPPGSIVGQCMCDLWWSERHWGRFFSEDFGFS